MFGCAVARLYPAVTVSCFAALSYQSLIGAVFCSVPEPCSVTAPELCWGRPVPDGPFFEPDPGLPIVLCDTFSLKSGRPMLNRVAASSLPALANSSAIPVLLTGLRNIVRFAVSQKQQTNGQGRDETGGVLQFVTTGRRILCKEAGRSYRQWKRLFRICPTISIFS